MDDQHRRKRWYSLIFFNTVVLASGWLGVLLDTFLRGQQEGNILGMLLWLVLPFITVIILRGLNHDWKDFGINPNIKDNSKWYVVAFLIYTVVTIITVGLALLFGSDEQSSYEMYAFFHLSLFLLVAILSRIFLKSIRGGIFDAKT